MTTRHAGVALEIVGEWTLGPRTNISFMSRPIALPGRTCTLRHGNSRMVVRVRDRVAGVSHGDVVDSYVVKSKPVETGLQRWRRAIEEGFDADQVL